MRTCIIRSRIRSPIRRCSGYLIDFQGMLPRHELAADTRIAESTISEVLSGKRKLNRAQIGKLRGTSRSRRARSRLGSEGGLF